MSEFPAPPGSDSLPELRSLGETLLAARRSQGLGQEELADRLRLGTDQLDALEQGDRRRLPEPVFVIAQAKRVAGALGISIDDQITALRRSSLMRPSTRLRPAAVALDQADGEGSRQDGRWQAGSGRGPWLKGLSLAVLALAVATTMLLTLRRANEGRRLSPPPPAAPTPLPAPRP